MRLVRLKADGFGVLRGEYQFSPDRLNLVLDRNERGKTSLLHAIVAGLYGLDRDGRRYRGLFTPLERWRPWDGGTFRVELDVESEGETYTIYRDFSLGTTAIWNARGQDITPDFMTEKDDFSVGQQLLGLDAEEFAKCAFWRQGELGEVVPDLEKDRRTTGLQGRLESAVDTRSGDASAIEALQALDEALARYASAELGTTITVDNAIKRLQTLRDTLAVEIQSLEHDYRAVTGSLEEIARLDDEERGLAATLRGLDARRMMLRADDARRRLARDAERRAEIERLRGEAARLEGPADVPADAQATLSAQSARLEEIRRQIETLRMERQAIATEVSSLDAARVLVASAADCSAEDADRLAVGAGELRGMIEAEARERVELEAGEAEIRGRGLDPARARVLLPRFARLTLEQSDLLREQPRLALARHAEIASAEQARTAGRATLSEIELWKRPRYVGGGILLGLGLVGIADALLGLLLIPRTAMLVAGAMTGALGVAALVATSLARRALRDEARSRIAAAEEQIRQAERHAAESEAKVTSLAGELGYAAPSHLIADWDEAQRLRELHGPVEMAEQQLAALEQRRGQLIEDTWSLLERAGGGNFTPESLDEAAARGRRRVELDGQRAGTARRLEAPDAEIGQRERGALESERAAEATIGAAGLEYRPGRPWADWIAEVGARVQTSARRRMIVEAAIPAIERELLDAATVAALRAEIERADDATRGVPAADVAEAAKLVTAVETESRIVELRGRLEAIRAMRGGLENASRGAVERYHADHPDRCARLAVVEHELRRAQRFRDAATLARQTIERVARETHRRWADFLNERVAELLGFVGSSVARIRFGEDLDFAVTMTSGPQTARGKALHQLSSGARDQLHLAVRLAISEFLSRGGERLPLLVDDCFATSDDERARAGMRLLLETFSRQHQIVLVSCHRQRYRALASLDAALYDDRVHWVQLRPEMARAAAGHPPLATS